MTYYTSCGWAPFGWTQEKATNVGKCNDGTVLKDGKCVANCGTNTKLEGGKCVLADNVGYCGTRTKSDDGYCKADTQKVMNKKIDGLALPIALHHAAPAECSYESSTDVLSGVTTVTCSPPGCKIGCPEYVPADIVYTAYDDKISFDYATTIHACNKNPNFSHGRCYDSQYDFDLQKIQTYCETASVRGGVRTVAEACEIEMISRALDLSHLQHWCVANPDAEGVWWKGTTQPCDPLREQKIECSLCTDGGAHMKNQWYFDNIHEISPYTQNLMFPLAEDYVTILKGGTARQMPSAA